MAVTIDAVMKTADLLVARGEKPTLNLIRKAMGERSCTIIWRGLKEWRQHTAKAALDQHSPIPEAIMMDSRAMAEALQDLEADVEATARLADNLTEELKENQIKLMEAEDRLAELESKLAIERNRRLDLERVKVIVESRFGCC